MTAEIHIPHWVSLSSRMGRSWCSISHLCSDSLWLTLRCWRGLGAMSLVLGIPGDNGLWSPRINIYLGAACTDGRGRGGREGDPGEGNSRQDEHPWKKSVGWIVFGVHLPLCWQQQSPQLQALLQAHLQSLVPEWKMDAIASGSRAVWHWRHYELVCEIWPHSWFSS